MKINQIVEIDVLKIEGTKYQAQLLGMKISKVIVTDIFEAHGTFEFKTTPKSQKTHILPIYFIIGE